MERWPLCCHAEIGLLLGRGLSRAQQYVAEELRNLERNQAFDAAEFACMGTNVLYSELRATQGRRSAVQEIEVCGGNPSSSGRSLVSIQFMDFLSPTVDLISRPQQLISERATCTHYIYMVSSTDIALQIGTHTNPYFI